MSGRISIDPITRLEGHGRIEIFLDERGDVANAYFQVPELRGFEQFCLGRPAEDMPSLTARICGICPEAHHLAATKALDELFQVEPPPAARKLRELLYATFFVLDHTLHFYVLGGPDFLVGPDAPPAERNVLGAMRRLGAEAARGVVECRSRNDAVIRLLGGRSIHPVAGLPGGWSKPLDEAGRQQVALAAQQNVEFALASLALFEQRVLGNSELASLLLSDAYTQETYSIGTVDPQNRLDLYDGQLRVVDPEGREFARFEPRDYARHVGFRCEPWTYLKFPYLSAVGWKGFTEGAGSGVYSSTPLARLNVADGMATPLAQQHFERMYERLSGRGPDGRFLPIHRRMATHWARLVELLHAAERMLELALDPEITSPDVRRLPERRINPAGGTGAVEAPRGTLIHHYEADERGLLTRVSLVVGTMHNHAPIAMSILRAARAFIRAGRVVEEGLLNRVEMAYRLYDPCLSCATHAIGTGAFEVAIRDAAGELVRVLKRQG